MISNNRGQNIVSYSHIIAIIHSLNLLYFIKNKHIFVKKLIELLKKV